MPIPLPGAKAHSLLARIGATYTYVGTGSGTHFRAGNSGYLTLFVNDDVPGSGYFGVESLSIG